MSSMFYDENRGWVIDGQSREEFETSLKPITNEDLEEWGIIESSSTETSEDTLVDKTKQLADNFTDDNSRPTGVPYEKLNAWETAKDVGTAMGVEALHFFQPKDKETEYIERTHFAENMKYLQRYTIGTLGFGKVGWGLKAAKAVPKLGKLAKVGEAIDKGLHFPEQITKTGIGKAIADNLIPSMIASFALRRAEEGEGQLMDMVGETNNEFLKAMQTNPNDSEFTDRMKAMLGDTVAGVVLAPIFTKIVSPLFKGLGNKTTAEVSAEKLEKVLDNTVLIDNVQKAMSKANSDGVEDVERYILDADFTTKDNEQNVLDIYNKLKQDIKPIPTESGKLTFELNNWKQAADLSIEDLKLQTDNDGISLMDKAVKDIWTERGWLGADENLVNYNAKTNKYIVNTKAVNRVVKQYTDKFQLDNNIKVEWVEGKINGADGNTLATSYKGKTAKNSQNAIDKKKLQIKQIEDKITMEEGGNAEVSDPLDTLKEQLRIANNELKQLTDTASKSNLVSNITITINKNAENPYAVLRSELEHARDIAKREVPNQSEKHFNRYNGINESEMSLEYVKKKADTRAGKTQNTTSNYKYKTKKENTNGLDTQVKQILNSKGEVLAEVKATPRGEDFEIRMDNYGLEKGTARKALAELMSDYPNKEFYWEAINEQSVKSYKHFIEEYPELVDRVRFYDNSGVIAGLDSTSNNLYTPKKGVIDEKGSNQSQNIKGTTGEVRETDSRADTTNVRGNEEPIYDEWGIPLNNERRTVSKDIHNSVRTGEITDNNARPISEQLTSTDGDLASIDNILQNKIDTDVELSGTDWTALAKDTDGLYARLKTICGDNLTALKEAFTNNDIDMVNAFTRKVLAAERVIGDLLEQSKQMIKSKQDTTELIQAMDYLVQYSHQLGSAYGRGLNEFKVIGKARDFFTLTTLEKQGLNSFVDLLHTELTSLNFTQPIKQLKSQLYSKVLNEETMKTLNQNPSLFKNLDNKLTKLLEDKTTDPEVIYKELKKLITDGDIENIEKFIQWHTDKEAFVREIGRKRDWGTIYINNLLSSPTTHFLNAASGVCNSLYFPAKKILAGLIDKIWTGDDRYGLIDEGIKTYHEFFGNSQLWQESWKLAMQAFKTGEGVLVSLGNNAYETLDENTLMSLGDLSKAKWQDLLTLPCRLLGAADEMVTELNYRAVLRAKVLKEAEEIAQHLPENQKEKFIADYAETNFKAGFNNEGKALDLAAYEEARDIVLQTPLDGKYIDFKTGNKVQRKQVSLLMRLTSVAQQAVQTEPLVKFVLPFVRTNTNIVQQGLEHNIFYNVLSPTQRRLLTSNTKEGLMLKSQCATGLLSMGIGLSFAINGVTTGAAPRDKTTADALYKTGWQPYSFRIGNKYYSYKGIEPLHSIFGFMADCWAIQQAYNPTEPISENLVTGLSLGTRAIMKNFIDKTAFRSSTDVLSSIIEAVEQDDPDKIGKTLASIGRGFMPYSSLGNYVANQIDSEQRKPTGFYENLFNKYFVKGFGDYRRNIFGERQDMFYTLGFIRTKEIEDLPEDIALQELAEMGWKPSEMSSLDSKWDLNYKSYKAEGQSLYDLMLEEQSMIKLEGRTLREAIRELVTSEDYELLPIGIETEDKWTKNTKINNIKAIFKRYKDAAKEKILDEYGEDFTNKEGFTAKEEQQLILEAQQEAALDYDIEQDIEDIRSFN